METELTKAEGPTQGPSASVVRREGFTEAFDALYECAHRHAYKLLGDRQHAEDVAQEACTRACLRRHELVSPRAWVTHVTTNLAFDRLRRPRAAAK
jgi:DNA-directed RNA polymerase specialized sigma24 family protein